MALGSCISHLLAISLQLLRVLETGCNLMLYILTAPKMLPPGRFAALQSRLKECRPLLLNPASPSCWESSCSSSEALQCGVTPGDGVQLNTLHTCGVRQSSLAVKASPLASLSRRRRSPSPLLSEASSLLSHHLTSHNIVLLC